VRTTKAQRIRFGVLAARHQLERGRLTDWQVDYLEGMELAGWIIGDWGTLRAYEQEYSEARSRVALKEFGPRAAALRKKWMKP
jgi:hypothetical protein